MSLDRLHGSELALAGTPAPAPFHPTLLHSCRGSPSLFPSILLLPPHPPPPCISHPLLSLAEFMERHGHPLPISPRMLADVATLCGATSKALRYRETEFHTSRNPFSSARLVEVRAWARDTHDAASGRSIKTHTVPFGVGRLPPFVLLTFLLSRLNSGIGLPAQLAQAARGGAGGAASRTGALGAAGESSRPCHAPHPPPITPLACIASTAPLPP